MNQNATACIDRFIETLNHVPASLADAVAPTMIAYDDRPVSDLLGMFFENIDQGMLEEIASNPCTPSSILMRLAEHCKSRVREAVADNPSASIEVLMTLARDQDPDIRFAMAENHNLHPDILVVLMDDENPFVVDRAERTYRRATSAGQGAEIRRFLRRIDTELVAAVCN
ncbi:MAG: hypothetical protein KC777_02315 [Cyanobacteria bacterium HKST-UBA02]|nr:hypothetical protein [Cyanobacteria bacterium HKST-UBA02]